MLFLIKNWFLLVSITSLCSSFLPVSPPFPFRKPLRVLSLFPFLPPFLSSFNHLPLEVELRNICISGVIREHRFSRHHQVSSSLFSLREIVRISNIISPTSDSIPVSLQSQFFSLFYSIYYNIYDLLPCSSSIFPSATLLPFFNTCPLPSSLFTKISLSFPPFHNSSLL